MRKYIFILLCVCLWNCTEDEIPVYNGKQALYFSIKTHEASKTFLDEMNFSFGMLTIMDTVFQIPVSSTGSVADYDRYFDFVVDSTSATEGVHFELPEKGVIPAGKAKGYIPVTLYRIPDDNEIYTICFRLLSDDNFELNLPEAYTGKDTIDLIRMTLNFSSSIAKPKKWSDSWFGYFSVAKYNTFSAVCGKDADFWDSNVSAMDMMALGSAFKAYVEQKILEGQEVALRDPSNSKEKGYMTMRGVKNCMTIPDSWPVVEGK